MDQLKTTLAVLKKHYFWIVCGLILLTYFATWYQSTSSISRKTETLAEKIKATFSKGEGILRIQNHPNPSSAEMMNRLIGGEAEQVRLAWERRFREQENVLRWPQELLPDLIAAVEPLKPIELKVEFPTPADRELKREFRNRYSDYIQKELPKLAEIIGAQWDTRLTTERENQGLPGGGPMGPGDGFRGRMGAAGMAGMDGKAVMPAVAGVADMGRRHGWAPGQVGEDPRVVVVWSPTNQAALQTASFDWTRPTTLQILYAQENLWVLRALMLVIKATNGDADAQYNAAIKEIMAIELGRAADGIMSSGQVSRGPNSSGGGAEPGDTKGGGKMSPEMMALGKMGPGMPSPGMPSPGMPSPGMPSPGMPGPGMPGTGMPGPGKTGPVGPGMGGPKMGFDRAGTAGGASPGPGMPGAAGRYDPADYRYVNDKGQPLTGAQLRTAMASNQPEDAFLAVAKRMRVRLQVRMDVRKLPLFLCECANSNLPVEIRQVRINAPAGVGSFGGRGGLGEGMGGMGGMEGKMGSGMSPGMPGMGGIEGKMGSRMGLGMGVGARGRGGVDSDPSMGGATDSPYDATVEVYGVIYIYNPVNPEKLGLGQKDAGTPVAQDPAAAARPGGQVDTSDEEVAGEDTVSEDPDATPDDDGNEVEEPGAVGFAPPGPDPANGKTSKNENEL